MPRQIRGANEWEKCNDKTEARELWRTHLGGIESNWENIGFIVKRQPEYPENFSLLQNRILHIGLNMVTGFQDSKRMKNNKDWVEENVSNYSGANAVIIYGSVSDQDDSVENSTLFDYLKNNVTKSVIYATQSHLDSSNWKDRKDIIRVRIKPKQLPPIDVSYDQLSRNIAFGNSTHGLEN